MQDQAKYRFNEGDSVEFSYSGLSGYGLVVGCALAEIPLVGKHYIISVTSSNIDPNEYPFSCVSLPEHCLKIIK